MGFLMGVSTIFPQVKPNDSLRGKSLERKVHVIDAKTNEPLPGANIYLENFKGTSTDSDGNAVLTSKKDTIYHVKISYIGYNDLEKEISIKKSEPELTIALNPSQIKSPQVVVTSKKEDEIDELLRTSKDINEKSVQNTQLLTGTATEQIFAQMNGATTTPGKTFFFSSDENDELLRYQKIPMKINDFLGFGGVLSSENTNFTISEFPLPPEKEGMMFNLKAEMKKPKSDLELLTQINQLKAGVQMGGNLNFLGNSSWFALSYEGNISGLYLKSEEIHPRDNKYFGVFSSDFGSSSLTLSGISKNAGIILNQNDKSPSLYGDQTGISVDYKKVGSKSSFEIFYVFNQTDKKYGLENFVSSDQRETMHEIKGEFMTKTVGFLTAGFDIKKIFYSQNILFDSQNLSYESLKEKIPQNNNSEITPTQLFFNQEIPLSKKSALSFGTGFMFDLGNFKKNYAVGPYLRFGTEFLGIKTKLTGGLRFSYVGLKPYSDEVQVEEYTTSDYPKSFQSKLEFEKGPFELGVAYYNFYNQPQNNIVVNPLREYFNSSSENINGDSLRAAIILNNPQIINDSKSMEDLNKMISTLPETKKEISDSLGLYQKQYYSNPNRHGFAAFASLRTKNAFLSATLSKTFEGKTNIPYINDVELILKGHVYSDLEKILSFVPKDLFTVSAYFEYSTGRPYTGVRLLPSIAQKKGISSFLEKYKEDMDLGYYRALTESRRVPQARNQERYPSSITSSVSLTYNMKFSGDIVGHLCAYLNNPHNLFNIVEKNTFQIYYTTSSNGKLVKKEGKGIGCVPGVDFTMNIPLK